MCYLVCKNSLLAYSDRDGWDKSDLNMVGKRQSRWWWTETICHSEEGGSYVRCLEAYWALTESGQFSGMNHLFFLYPKGGCYMW